MSEGKWVWCPLGWKVVPETLTPEMLAAAWPVPEGDGEMPGWREGAERNRYRDTLDAAPEPPSGWNRGYPEDNRSVFPIRALYERGVVLGYWQEAKQDDFGYEWWTELLPPPPEDRL